MRMYALTIGLRYDGFSGEYAFRRPFAANNDEGAIDMIPLILLPETEGEGVVGIGLLSLDCDSDGRRVADVVDGEAFLRTIRNQKR